MANLSLCETTQSQLSQTPIISGQLICCLDTGTFYRDTDVNRINLGADIIYVSELPLAPISNKVYLVKPNKLYYFNDGDWVYLNDTSSIIASFTSLYNFPVTGIEGALYIDKTANKTYRWDNTNQKYYCVGSDYNDLNIIYGGGASD